MKLKLIILSLFVLSVSILSYINLNVKNERINLILETNVKELQLQYNLTMSYFIQDAKSIRKNISTNTKAIEIFKKAQNATKEERTNLRNELYTLLSPMYKRIHSRGILQWQFVFPNNISFLRMHKPSKFGDNLSDIRFSFKYANQTKKTIVGFEQGRTTHAFRYVFPYYDKQKNHLGAVEISLSSYALQDKLLNVNKLHSHFLIKKNIFDAKIWNEIDNKYNYIQSIEHKDFKSVYKMNVHNSKDKMSYMEHKIIKPLQNEINNNISKKEPFSLYLAHKTTVKIITFLPIFNTQKKDISAYIVTYKDDNNMYNIIQDYYKFNLVIFIGLLLISYFIYQTLNSKAELVNKSHELQSYLDVIDDIEIGLFIVSKDFKVEFMNKTMKKWFGDQTNQICYKAVAGLDEPCPYCKINEVIFSNEKVNYTPTTADGQTFDIISAPIENLDGSISKMEVIKNITEQKQLEKQLVKSEKMVAMGEMIGNIAHQWRQPLSVITTGATGIIMQKELDILNDEKLIDTCNIINDNAQYLSQTIDDFRNFIKGDRVKSTFNLKDTIDSFLHLIEGAIKSNNITMVLNLEEDMKIEGYENELKQCLINIFNNSKDALNENNIKEKFIFITIKAVNNKAIITLKDNANGIPTDILPKIFEPYFTTKSDNNGTGLGLYMTYDIIVNGMEGQVEATNINYNYENKNYKGAQFTITLNS